MLINLILSIIYIEQDQEEKNEAIKSINIKNDKNVSNFAVSKGVWSPLNDRIFALCSDNSLRIVDVEKGVQIKKLEFVTNLKDKMKLDNEVGTELTDLAYNKDMCTAVVCSRAKYAKVNYYIIIYIISLHKNQLKNDIICYNNIRCMM